MSHRHDADAKVVVRLDDGGDRAVVGLDPDPVAGGQPERVEVARMHGGRVVVWTAARPRGVRLGPVAVRDVPHAPSAEQVFKAAGAAGPGGEEIPELVRDIVEHQREPGPAARLRPLDELRGDVEDLCRADASEARRA